jgi:branched-chain amino acid transport system ATP-binding protein
MSGGDLLRAEAVSVAFGGVRALGNVTLSVGEDEIVGVIGPNGAGKTVLLNVLTGFVRAKGTVELRGTSIAGWSPQRIARAGVARTFQGVRPFARLSVRENVELAALGTGASSREARRRGRNLLSTYGLDPYASLPSGALPAGSLRRLGLARALAAEPDLLLLDEPAAGLNEVEGDELMQLIADARRDLGCSVVLVEHSMRVVMGLCERIHVLDYGETLASGSPEEIRSNPEVSASYLGTESSMGEGE